MKEHIMSEGLKPKIARLMDMKKIKRNDDGDYEGIQEELDRVKGEFPELFPTGEEDEPEKGGTDRRREYRPPSKKGNKSTDTNPADRGRQRARERFGKNKEE